MGKVCKDLQCWTDENNNGANPFFAYSLLRFCPSATLGSGKLRHEHEHEHEHSEARTTTLGQKFSDQKFS